MSIDWGSVPDWFAGAGALVALFFARSAVLSARETNRAQAEQIAQLEQDRRARDDERRAEQATRIAVWVSTDFADRKDHPAVRLINSSPLPVYNMLIVCRTPRAVREESYTVIGPLSGRRTLVRATRILREVVAGGDFLGMHDRGEIQVSWSFRDSVGWWWFRTVEGELHAAGDRDAAEQGARAGSVDPGATRHPGGTSDEKRRRSAGHEST